MLKVQTALILAGGKGTRFSEYTDTIPKPMIEANGKPLLIHIMNIYISQGVKKFIVLTGYKSDFILNYFKNDSEFNFRNNLFESDQGIQIKILDTGIETQTGGRIKKALKHILITKPKFNGALYYTNKKGNYVMHSFANGRNNTYGD